MLSRMRMGLPHCPQQEAGRIRLRPAGKRTMQTLRKLPTALPSRNSMTSRNTVHAATNMPSL